MWMANPWRSWGEPAPQIVQSPFSSEGRSFIIIIFSGKVVGWHLHKVDGLLLPGHWMRLPTQLIGIWGKTGEVIGESASGRK
jgi:hypothetical protein